MVSSHQCHGTLISYILTAPVSCAVSLERYPRPSGEKPEELSPGIPLGAGGVTVPPAKFTGTVEETSPQRRFPIKSPMRILSRKKRSLLMANCLKEEIRRMDKPTVPIMPATEKPCRSTANRVSGTP